MYLGILLNRMWFRPVLARTTSEAVSIAQNKDLSLVVLDADFPVDELRQSLFLLRSEPSIKSIPIVALAASGNSFRHEEFIAQGCSAVVTKPLDLSLFYGLLNRLSGQPRATPRVPVKMRVEIEEGKPEKFLTSVNISEGGLYLRTVTPLPEGTVLHLKFTLPRDVEPMTVVGMVVRTSTLGKELDVEPGMGIKFENLSENDRNRLKNFVQWDMAGDLEWEASY